MPSIRRSLIAYFLIILGLALGGVGLMIDQFARDALSGQERAEVDRIEQNYQHLKNQSEAAFNTSLKQQADSLGREFRQLYVFYSRRDRDETQRFRTLLVASLLGSGASGRDWGTQAYMYGLYSSGFRNPFFWSYYRQQIDDQVRRSFAEGHEHPSNFQFQFPFSGRVISGPGQSSELPELDVRVLNRRTDLTPGGGAIFEDITVGQSEIRRVVIKAPVLPGGPFRFGFPDPSRNMVLPALLGGVSPPFTPFYPERLDPLPYVFVQYGRPRHELESQWGLHAASRDQALQEQAASTREALARLRLRLAVIGVVTFAALAVGGWLLVGRGLSPLRKLSDAVSRVSEKDFRLPVETEELSHELVPIHDRLTHTLNALRRAFEREKQATADISHELRTPIASLLTTLEVALRKPRSAEQYRGTLEECREISKQLSRLVERIMMLAWIDAGNDRITKTEVDVATVAKDCATVIRPLAEAHGLTFSADFEPNVRTVTDPDKMREVLLNLLHNAIEYNRPGGTVSLAVSRENGSVQFEVRDTGIGMTPDVKGKIFERFYRADPSRTATGVHAGLGLAIVKEYVDRLGGEIAVESEPEHGTTFRITLPAGISAPKVARDGVRVR